MLTPDKKTLFIINKRSGTGFQSTIEEQILEACEKQNIACSVEYTQARGHAISLARSAAAHDFQYVVAVGGDGTINEVAQGLINSQTAMGILPRGSGNGLARHLGIPVSLPKALNSLFNSKIIAIDTFTVNDRLSLNVSGIGFDGQVANLFADKKMRGLFGYVKLTLKEFFKFPEFGVEVTIDGKKLLRKPFLIAIANSSQYGNNVRIAPLASVCDGLLHISMIKKIPLYRLDFIFTLLRGQLKESKLCEIFETSELTIKSSSPTPYHLDGEPCGFNDTFRIKIMPASLLMLVPKVSPLRKL